MAGTQEASLGVVLGSPWDLSVSQMSLPAAQFLQEVSSTNTTPAWPAAYQGLGFVRTLAAAFVHRCRLMVAAQISARHSRGFLVSWSTAGCLRYNVSSSKAIVRLLMSLLVRSELQQTPALRYMSTLMQALELLTLYCMRPAVHNKSLS